MASNLNPVLNPNFGEKPWVDQISKTLKTQIAFTIDTPPVSIFEIPKPLKTEKPEAYVPQRVGLGLNHHFQPELYYKMEQKKLIAVKRVITPYKIHDYEQKIVEKVKKIVPLIRDCYDLYHDADDNVLAWLFTVDGMFLIDQLNTYANNGSSMEANDLIMLENQIPLIVLNEIQKALLGKEDFLESKFRYFCNSNSSFVLSEKNIDFSQVHHLLDYMYKSIVCNEALIPKKVDFTHARSVLLPQKDAKLEVVQAVIKFIGVIPGAQPFLQVIEFVMQKFGVIAEETTVEEIRVPSVSQLGKVAGVEFRLSPKNEGIRNIKFVEEKVKYCYLPLMTLNRDSEVVLRNLVAYEDLMAKNSFKGGYGLELTEYVDFMCGIIDTPKDVKLLREQKIIEGDLSDEEIVRLFNGIGKSRLKMSGESELRKTVAQLNMVYESTPQVWVRRMIEKRFLASAKFIMFILTIATAMIMIREAYLVRSLRAKLSRLLQVLFGPGEQNATI